MTHCCSNMARYIQNKAIDYEPIDRTYGIIYDQDPLKQAPSRIAMLKYCPWCASNLPKRLHQKIFTVLNNEYGIEDPDLCDFTNVPPEFRTDAWWKKRGL